MMPLVSTNWLAEHLGEPGIVVCDCSFHLPADGRDAAAEYRAARIPGSRLFDIETIADRSTGLPHMLPGASVFADMVGALGIDNESTVIFYDQKGLFSAARGWWMMAAFGHDRAAVLDGGLPKWRAEGRTLDIGPPMAVAAASFTSRPRPELVRDLEEMRDLVQGESAVILDARAANRFAGTAPEPRPGLRSGHIRGAHNLPFTELLAGDGTMLLRDQLRARFAAAGVDGTKPVVTSCGSGVTAAVLSLGLAVAGLPRGALYDGSWAEWGSRPETAPDSETYAA